MATPTGTITEAFVQQYADNFLLVSQQKKSRLESCCRPNMGIVGASKSVDRAGSTSSRKRTSRNEDSPLIKTPFDRRWLDLVDYDWGDLIDDQDKLKMLIDPTSAVIASGVAALNRDKDDVIIAAMRGSARAGTGDSATTVALPAGQKIAVGTDGLTLAKLITAKEVISAAEAYNEDDPGDQLHIAVTAKQISELLNDTKVTSGDFATVKALVAGTIDTFMGFKFHRTQRLIAASTTRYCLAWCQSGMDFGMGNDIERRLSERPDKSFTPYAYAKMSVGAVRNEDEKVVEIACKE